MKGAVLLASGFILGVAVSCLALVIFACIIYGDKN